MRPSAAQARTQFLRYPSHGAPGMLRLWDREGASSVCSILLTLCGRESGAREVHRRGHRGGGNSLAPSELFGASRNLWSGTDRCYSKTVTPHNST
jgi:hypothetical protein